MKKFLSLFVAIVLATIVNAQESGHYYLYAYDKTNAANIYIELTSTDGDMYSATGQTFNGSTDLSGVQVIYGNWEVMYAPAADTWPEVKLGTVIDLENGGTGSGWVYGWTLEESNYVFFQLSTMKLAFSENDVNPITGTSSIHSATNSENPSSTYYNMQGIRQSHPTPGLYIMKQGGKTTKVVIE